MFEKTVTDVVKGIRASKRDTALFISQCIAEIKTEIHSKDMFVKANALQKLTFLQMMGYSMSWASFATIEVMSSPRFAHKRIGYLAACQGFTQDTEVVLLTTNLLKKELRAAVGVGSGMQGVYEAGLAINCISNIVTEDLARDLLPEVTNLTSHPQPYLRKKAILCLFKLFVKYPQGLRLTFAKIQQCLDDSNTSVVSCAVNVIAELSDKNPKNYLHLAPAFFQLLTQSSNNWMLIKVVKLLGSLVPEEPRLARKLLEPLASIVRNTAAKSLLYEAVHTITLCLPYCRKGDGTMPAIVPDIVTLCAQTLRDFVEQADQNLKYLGLVGFGSLMVSHPKILSDPNYRPLILACLSDEDVTIRSRALDLLTGMASRKNLVELVTQLLKHVELAMGTYKHDLVAKIVDMCSSDKYALLQDFGWYLDVLFQLGRMRGVEVHADLLRAQITDVALRVFPVRAYAVRRCMDALLEGGQDQHEEHPSDRQDGVNHEAGNALVGDNGRGKHIMPGILPAIAWIIGEYSDLIAEAVMLDLEDDDDSTDLAAGPVGYTFNSDSTGTYHSIVQALSHPMNSQRLPTSTQKVYLQAALKVFAAGSAASRGGVSDAQLETILLTIHQNFPVYMQSTDVEVVERSFTLIELLKSLNLVSLNSMDLGAPDLIPVFHGEGDEPDAEGDSESDTEEADFLAIDGTISANTGNSKSKRRTETKTNRDSRSLADRIRSVSDTLNHLLKPSPMKPIGAKAQRKKRQSPIGVTVDLDAPVDLSIFMELIEEEETYRASSRLTMEAVSFTQQRPLQVDEPAPLQSTAAIDMAGIGSSDVGSSFQRPGAAPGAPRPRQDDPFYLSAARSTDDDDDKREPNNRLGTIQLMDSDDDDDRKPGRQKKEKKKKEKKTKRSKSKGSIQSDLLAMGTSIASGTTASEVLVYESDEDDDDDGNAPRNSSRGGKRVQGKEFEKLARVDLLKPLREDEVMPERRHHVVATRQPASVQEPEIESREKKKSKKSKKKSKQQSYQDTGGVGDLLDLGFGGLDDGNTSLPVSTTPAPASGINPINSAFDDLLGLSESAPTLQFPTMNSADMFSPTAVPKGPGLSGMEGMSSSTALKRSTKRPWLKASMTSSSASGTLDWSQVLVSYRVYESNSDTGGGVGASFVVRIINGTPEQLYGLSLDVRGSNSVTIGTIMPGFSTETPKIGPFVCATVDESETVTCTLRTSTSYGTFKLHIPVSLFMNPEENLSLDQVVEELSASGWFSYSAKTETSPDMTTDAIKQRLCSFLHVAEVVGGSATSANFTLAGRSTTGIKVRVLVKVKASIVKLDIRATNSSLGKALASDIKRLQA